jgi:hypothetical protein
MRQLQAGTARNYNKDAYKSHNIDRPSVEPRHPSPHFFPPSALRIGIGIMVAAWLIVKTFVAFSPLTSVYAQYGEPYKLPLLLDATGEELTVGLEEGHFTSADLVQVSIIHLFFILR